VPLTLSVVPAVLEAHAPHRAGTRADSPRRLVKGDDLHQPRAPSIAGVLRIQPLARPDADASTCLRAVKQSGAADVCNRSIRRSMSTASDRLEPR